MEGMLHNTNQLTHAWEEGRSQQLLGGIRSC